MSLFWLEYLHFIAVIVAIVVSISAFVLFLITYRYERQLKTVWRALGFLFLAIAFFLFILERKYVSLGLAGVLVSTIGFFSVYKGVLAEPKLSHLRKLKKVKDTPKILASMFELLWFALKQYFIYLLLIVLAFVFFGVLFIMSPEIATIVGAYMLSALEFLALIFILLTIRIQIKRYRTEGKDKATRRLNFYPLIGYIFLAIRGVACIFYRLPEVNNVFLHNIHLDFNIAWQVCVWATLLAFIFIGLWAWTFIKLREFLRTFIDFLTIAIIVSSLGSLVFTTLIFKTVEQNNLNLMSQATETQSLILDERAKNAAFVAKTMADDQEIVTAVRNNIYSDLYQRADEFLDNSNLDVIRIYNSYGEVLASPSDERERGRLYDKDSLVAYTILEKKAVKSFEVQEGVLAPVMVARALYPLIVGDTIIGSIETGYVFDNAFVDFSKNKTGLDVTMYTGNKRSATTILTQDGVSRWVGSAETDPRVLQKVLTEGQQYRTTVDRLGQVDYSAFSPITNVNNQIIGMVSVGVPTYVLFEATRQQLVSSFLIVAIISIIAAAIAYYILFTVRRRNVVGK